ncbi:MAG: acyl-CoA thioesterase II [Gemmatimonadetes bacterium]|nr:acyl-CoA thioesterase II [Gemmatimonadota bacterium]
MTEDQTATDELQDLIDVLELEQLEVNLFRGRSRELRADRVFGGQVLGQALSAAGRTVEDREVHSLHAYFLRAGDPAVPIVYNVDRSRDGRSFTNRRVVAIQHGRPILNLAASFQVPEEGLTHGSEMPGVPSPDELQPLHVALDECGPGLPDKVRRLIDHQRPFEFRPVNPVDVMNPRKRPPRQCIWFRTVSPVNVPEHMNRCLLAYVSDYNLLPTAVFPHGVSFLDGRLQMASLDHAMWFHHPAPLGEWLLYDIESPGAAGGRGFTRASIYAADGTLIASTAQEGVIRLWEKARLPS